MKEKVFLLFVSLSLFTSSAVFSQKWVKMMQDRNVNFYDVKKEFNDYYSKEDSEHVAEKKINQNHIHENEGEISGYMQYKRWEWFMEPRVYPTGERFAPDKLWQEVQSYQKKITPSPAVANWSFVGPSTVPMNLGGAGRVNCVRFDPTDINTIFVGTPSGGLWKTTDAGLNWVQWNTDQLPSIGITDIAIDPTNTQIMYIATGDGNASDTYSIGILKSIDGGLTWNTTGLNWQTAQMDRISRILIDTSNTQILHAATSQGVYRTTDGGVSWAHSITGNFKDMELKPGSPATIYAADGNTLYVSNDTGQTYAAQYSISNSGRIAIAVTPANPDYVYLLSSIQFDGGFNGVYRSTNSGLAFAQRCSIPNLLGYDDDGGDVGGQGWYNLAIAASPTDSNEVIIGGVNIWKSVDGGKFWAVKSHWAGFPYVHADQHDLIYAPGDGATFYSGCDGGVFVTSDGGNSWMDMSDGLHIAQIYRFGLSANDPDIVVSGWQDNATNIMNGLNWSSAIGGDGMECFIDRTDDNVMFGELYYGDFRRSTSGGVSWIPITAGLPSSGSGGQWVTPWMQDPVDPNILWTAYSSNVYKSTDQGDSWTKQGNIGASGLIALDVAPSNTQYIYTAEANRVIKSINGGSNWANVSSGLPVAQAAITYLKVSPTDPNHVWVTFSGYVIDKKVYVTLDGGVTWINYSTGLPNIPVNCIEYEKGTNGGVYVGTDAGVYYRDSTLTSWVPYNTGLPNVVVNELEIQYTAAKIRAATYGRGLWESPLYAAAGVHDFSSCANGCISVYPNPSNGEFDVQFQQDNSNQYTLEIINYLGQKIYSVQLKNISPPYKKHINLTAYGKGIYLLALYDEKSHAYAGYQKIIVK